MANKKTTKEEEVVLDSIVSIEEESKSQSNVTFTPEQMEVINKLINAQANRGSSEAVSVYNKRDIKKIETVNVSRFDNKFVIGFKNLNNDAYDTTPRYYEEKLDVVRKLPNQPFVTLILSDGKETQEKDVALVDYVNYRKKMQCNVVKIEDKEIIEDHGLLGRTGSDIAGMVDDSGRPVTPIAVRAESKRVIRTYYIEVPGFDKPVEFIEDFLA